MERATARILGLDGLRAIAVLMVFGEHRLDLGHLMLGAVGVYLFFVLSGFLIIGILTRERNNVASGLSTAKQAWIRFTVRRALRIMPIYYLAIGLVVMLNATLVKGIVFPGELPWLLTFTMNIWVAFVSHHWTAALSHFWSLGVEEQFYCLTAPILILGLLTTRRLCLAFLSLSIISFVVLSAAGFSVVTLLTEPLSNFGLFAFGGLLHTLNPQKVVRCIPNGLSEALLALLLIMPWLAGALFTGITGLIAVWLAGILMALLILSICARQEALAVRLLEWTPIAALGRISYGVYVYHYILSAELVRGISGGLIDVTGSHKLLSAAVLLTITIIVARVSWSLVEEPLLALKENLSPELRQRPHEPTP